MHDDFRPPDHYTPLGKLAFRVSGLLTVFALLSLFAYFVLPLVWTYISLPAGDWAYETVRSWTGEPYKPNKW